MDDEQNDQSNISTKKIRIKYPTFNQYVAKIGGDNTRFNRRLIQEIHDNNTYFAETITKWNDQDYGSHYTSFVNEIPSAELQTYAQLIHHKNAIIDCLVKHISDPENKSIPAFCEVLSSLVRDLKDEFYVHMWDVFTALINVLDFGERDIESVEAAFFTLTLLFKILWKKLKRDVKKTFTKFIPLFGSSREYVRRFASDAFAFLMRKLRDLREIARFIVKQAHRVGDSYLIDGCAVLFFHTYRGIAGGFHSTARELLLGIINGVLSIEDNEIRQTGTLILEKMVVSTIEYVKKRKNGDPIMLENTLLDCMEKFESMKHVTSVASLLLCCYVEKNWKKLFSSEERLFYTIEKILSNELCQLNNEFIEFIAQSILRIFNSEKWNLPIRSICDKLVAKADDDYMMVLDLFLAIRNIPQFDVYMMPTVGRIAGKVLSLPETTQRDLVPKIFQLYAFICLNRRPLGNVLRRERSAFFDVSHHTVAKNFLLSKLSMLCDLSTNEVASYVSTWPWMFGNTEKVLGNGIFAIIHEILLHIIQHKFRCQGCCESSLRIYRLFIEAKGSTTSMDKLKSVAELISPCFFNANNSVRRTAIEVLCSFNVPLEGSGPKDDCGISLPEPSSVFEILLAAEKCELVDSRRRLMYFRKLLYGSHTKSMPCGSGTVFEHIILRIGLSQFFVQFSLLWPGMHELLESFARGMAIDSFWTIMSDCFNKTNYGCRMDEPVMNSCLEDFIPDIDSYNRSNFLSARIQLLKFTAKISDLAERRTRFLSPIFLEFFEYVVFSISQSFYNCIYLLMFRKDFKCLDPDTQRLKGTSDSEHSVLNKPSPGEINKWEYSKTLCAFLDIYSKFNDAKSVFLEPKIRKMYETLLTVGIETVQKSTMACIYSYKIKAINQYREYFDNILEERAFRDQLVLFKINEEDDDSVIHPDHRDAVMPFLLRVIYGKLRMKTKKSHMASRRVAIFRYLGGCRPNELRYFFDIMFAPLLDIIGYDYINYHKTEEICSNKNIILNINLGQINRITLGTQGFHINGFKMFVQEDYSIFKIRMQYIRRRIVFDLDSLSVG
uniref:DRIM domain-containing protein n=1 Tax=Heterorhabditis bacteriophora TaxID=37862 RepID=A0A1I7XIM1_HETBA